MKYRMAAARKEQIRGFRKDADNYTDDEILGLASIARAALADKTKVFHGRDDAIRYVALNASAELKDLWVCDTRWKTAPVRVVEFDDMVQEESSAAEDGIRSVPFSGKGSLLLLEDEIRTFAFDMRKLFLSDRAEHLAICTRCRKRLEFWTGLAEKFDQALTAADRHPDA